MPQEKCYTLVTGATSEIGRALALQLSENRSLVLHGRNQEKLVETRNLCLGEGHLIWNYDLANVERLQSDFEAFVAENKLRVECFVHCAGTALVQAVRAMDLEAIRRTMDVNVTSAMLLSASLVKRKIAYDSLRSIVFISSIASQFGVKGFASYCASKAALDGVMRVLSVELAPRVRVNSVCLGAVMTDAVKTRTLQECAEEKQRQVYPLGVGTPSDAASAVNFLVSDKARWITGQQFVVDGGRTVDMTDPHAAG